MISTFFNVLFYMLLSALLAGWFAWWWTKRQYEDVTESYDELRSKARAAPQAEALTKADLDDRIASLSSSVASIPKPNLDPFDRRLSNIESAVAGFSVPETDMTPIYERMTRIDQRLAQPNGIENLERRLAQIEGTLDGVSSRVEALQNTDIGPLQTRFTTLESNLQRLEMPEASVDLGPLQSNIAQLELAIAEMDIPQTDLSPVQEQLTGLELRVVDLSEVVQESHGKDLEVINSKLTGLSSSFAAFAVPEMPNFDPVEQRLTNIERAVSNFNVPEIDFAPIEERLINVERAVSGITVPQTDLGAVEERLLGVERAVSGIYVPETNLGAVEDRLLSVERAVSSIPVANLDPLHVRLERLEQRLLAPSQDYQTLFAHLAGMEAAIDALDRGAVDLTPLQSRMMTLENSIAALRSEMPGSANLEPLERQLMSLQQSVRATQLPDLTAVVGSLRSIDSRLDMAAMENRLTAIEYGLTAVHHMLRSRMDTAAPITQIEPELYSNSAQTRAAETYTQPSVTSETRTRSYTSTSSADPLASARRPDDKSNLLVSAAFGESDDLERISGVGPMLSEMLNNIGVYYFWQVAEWDGDDIVWVDNKLQHFKGRIERDDWVGQAQEFAAELATANRP